MKFRKDYHKVSFLVELGLPIDTDLDNIGNLNSASINRNELVKKLKDHLTDVDWGVLVDFHDSTDGKQFRKNLSKILKHDGDVDTIELLKAISSLRTHLYIDLLYYRPILDQANYLHLLENVIPILNEVELGLLDNDIEKYLEYKDIICELSGETNG